MARVPAELARLCREAVAGQRRQHEVERVLALAAVRGRVGERADGLEQLDDRAGPAVRHDQRQRVLVRRADVNEVDVHTVDRGRELRQRVQSRLARAPVVIARPVARKRLHRGQLHALRPIIDQLCGRPARRLDPPAQLSELLPRNIDPERADGCCFGSDGHDVAPRFVFNSSASGSPRGARRRTAQAAPRRRSGRPCRLR